MYVLDVKLLNLRGGIIIHGPSVEVNRLIALVKEVTTKSGVRIIFTTTSSRRLHVKQERVEPSLCRVLPRSGKRYQPKDDGRRHGELRDQDDPGEQAEGSLHAGGGGLGRRLGTVRRLLWTGGTVARREEEAKLIRDGLERSRSSQP